MSATDAGFLYLERPHAPLQIGAVVELSGPLSVEELAQRIESRIAHVPRYAQRAMPLPLGLGHPQWEDATEFDPRDHLQRWALPAPAGDHELCQLAAQLLAQPLARDRPLWEMHLLDDAHDGRSALFLKVHHCMADGLSGVRLLDEILDVNPASGAAARGRAPAPPVQVQGTGLRVGRALGQSLRRQLHAAGSVIDAVRRPMRARATAGALRDAAWSALRLATGDLPEMPWNDRLGPRRELYFARLPLDGVARVRRALGGTVNDVVLCVLAGGLHRYLGSIGIRTRGLELTALVPVSLRRAEEGAALGNRISAILVPLPVDPEDEVARLTAMRAITERLKSASAWTGIDSLLQLLDDLPAGLVAAAARRLGRVRIANLVATNVPGPREPRFLCGRRVETIYPIVPITDGLGLGLAVLSYAGTLHVGLNADPGLVPDLEKLGSATLRAFEELRARC
jgi:WS/DGAT/MGAT family acyltransferase